MTSPAPVLAPAPVRSLPFLVAFIYTLMCVYIGGSLLIMALEWIHIGQGLNPWLVIPAGVAFLALPVFSFGLIRETVDEITGVKTADLSSPYEPM